MAEPQTPTRSRPPAPVEEVVLGVEQQLLRITRRWLSRTLLTGATVMEASCTPRPEPTAVDAGSPPPAPPAVSDAAPAAPTDEERARAERALAAERALYEGQRLNSERLLLTSKEKGFDISTLAPGGGMALRCSADQPLLPVCLMGLRGGHALPAARVDVCRLGVGLELISDGAQFAIGARRLRARQPRSI